MDDVRSGDRPDGWALALSDEPIIAAKSQANQLPFAVLLAFFRTHGRFPRPQEEIDPEAVAELAWRRPVRLSGTGNCHKGEVLAKPRDGSDRRRGGAAEVA